MKAPFLSPQGFPVRFGFSHVFVTPWRLTGDIKFRAGCFGRLDVLVRQHREICSTFGARNWFPQRWEYETRWRRALYADLQKLERLQPPQSTQQ